jgi:hypothetical protein
MYFRLPQAESVHEFRAYRRCNVKIASFLFIALALLVLWAACFLLFHVASTLIHLLLMMAVIFFVGHLVRDTSTT